MFKQMSFVFLLMLVVFSQFSFAAEVEVWGRSYDYSCGYFSRRAADLAITLHDKFPFGTEVNAIIGFQATRVQAGHHSVSNWEDRQVISAKAINVNSWEAKILDKTLHHRTEGRFLEALQFVFEVKIPGQAPRYINGGKDWSYFETANLNAHVGCVKDGNEGIPSWGQLKFFVRSG